MSRAAAALAFAALATMLSGCAAAVIPLYAGAMLINGPSTPGEVEAKPQASAPARISASNDLTLVPTSLSALPLPDSAKANPAIAAFERYALAVVNAPLSRPGTRASAIIPEASALRLVRRQCGAQPAAVFVDLDAGRGSFDPLAPGEADPSLAEALATLRGRGVKVVWFSRLGANFAAAARDALIRKGLDPEGQDELVLMRDLGERKQSLRDEVAKRYCPVALLGDERADFDELYLYLKDPSAAIALDAMIGKGWFLAHPFATPQTPVPETTP